MHSSDIAALKNAQQLFRDNKPEQALDQVRAVLKRDPEAADAAKFETAVLAHLNALMKTAILNGQYSEAIQRAKKLIFEPEFAHTAQASLLDLMRDRLQPQERLTLIMELSQVGMLPETFWQEASAALASLPSDPKLVLTGFTLLRHLPGHAATLVALSGHLAALGLPAQPEIALVDSYFEKITAMLGAAESSNDAPAALPTRKLVYDKLRADLSPMVDPIAPNSTPDLLAAEYAIQRIERSHGGLAAKRTQTLNVWSLLDPKSSQYVLQDAQPLSAETEKLLAAREPRKRSRLWRFSIILSLWLRSISFEASQDRIGYLWLVLDPLIHVLIICIVPLLLHDSQVADMNTFPFAIIGACYWLTFRAAATGALAGGGILKPQMSHPSVRRFDIILARGLSALVVYFFVGTALIFVTAYMGLSEFPVHLPIFVISFIVSWMFGMAYGIILHSLVLRYPGVRRINGFLIRFIAFTSGLFYVTEQLPDHIAAIFLWNPLLHVVQIARSAWFFTYKSRDADPIYVFYCLMAIILLSLACIIVDERRPESVRA